MSGAWEHPEVAEELLAVLASAARLQQAVPDAVLVGGSVAAMYAGHRLSFDHDHVLPDLQERYDSVLEAVEATDGWATDVRASKPPVTLMGQLGGIEAGLRQLRRRVPLETQALQLPDGAGRIVVPTADEALRVKAYLVLQRNQVRDYLDVAALADRLGPDHAAEVLAGIDLYYLDRSGDAESVATAIAERLADPAPRDSRTLAQLSRYKRLDPRWQDWTVVEEACRALADRMLEVGG